MTCVKPCAENAKKTDFAYTAVKTSPTLDFTERHARGVFQIRYGRIIPVRHKRISLTDPLIRKIIFSIYAEL